MCICSYALPSLFPPFLIWGERAETAGAMQKHTHKERAYLRGVMKEERAGGPRRSLALELWVSMTSGAMQKAPPALSLRIFSHAQILRMKSWKNCASREIREIESC